MTGGRIIRRAKIRAMVLTRPEREMIKPGVFENVCQIRVLPLKGGTIPHLMDDEADCLGVFWSLAEEETCLVRKGSIVSGEGFICHSEVLQDIYILITKWKIIATIY